MKHDPLKAEFQTAAGWLNHYHYRHGQYHTGNTLHPSEDAADEGRADYFRSCARLQEFLGSVTFFDLTTRRTDIELVPTSEMRADPSKAFYDDCVLHYALPEVV